MGVCVGGRGCQERQWGVVQELCSLGALFFLVLSFAGTHIWRRCRGGPRPASWNSRVLASPLAYLCDHSTSLSLNFSIYKMGLVITATSMGCGLD